MSEYEFEIVNVVGTGKLPEELDLSAVKDDLAGECWENESTQPGLHQKFHEDGPMTTFYPSGSYIIRAPSEEKLAQSNAKVLNAVSDLGIVEPDVDTEFAIKNVVGLATLGVDVDLNAVTIGLGLEHSEYEPEIFPALIYRRSKYPCTFLIFASGKVVSAGSKSEESSRESFEKFYNKELEWIVNV